MYICWGQSPGLLVANKDKCSSKWMEMGLSCIYFDQHCTGFSMISNIEVKDLNSEIHLFAHMHVSKNEYVNTVCAL